MEEYKLKLLIFLVLALFSKNNVNGEDTIISGENIPSNLTENTFVKDNGENLSGSKSGSTNLIEVLNAINLSVADVNNRVTSLESQITTVEKNAKSIRQKVNIHRSFLDQTERGSNLLEENQLKLREKIVALTQGYKKLRARLEGASNGTDSDVTSVVDSGALRRSSSLNIKDEIPTQEEGEQLIKSLVTAPNARLYAGENFSGAPEDYNFTMAEFRGGCQGLRTNFGTVKSVETFGSKCIRLFEDKWCQGWSLAIYPGSEDSLKVSPLKLDKVESVGPCLPYEFQYDSQTGRIFKNSSDPTTYVPDLNEFFSWNRLHKDNKISAESTPNVVMTYLLGPNDRVELLYSWIYYYPEDAVVNTTGENDILNKYEDKLPGDILGYGIPEHFGGPSKERYNVFAQSPSSQAKWADILSEVKSFLIERKQGELKVREAAVVSQKFDYKDDQSKRPTSFDYHISFRISLPDSGLSNVDKVIYGHIYN